MSPDFLCLRVFLFFRSYFFKSALFSSFTSVSPLLPLVYIVLPPSTPPSTIVLIKTFTVATSRNCDSASNGLVVVKIYDFLRFLMTLILFIAFDTFTRFSYELYPAASPSVEMLSQVTTLGQFNDLHPFHKND